MKTNKNKEFSETKPFERTAELKTKVWDPFWLFKMKGMLSGILLLSVGLFYLIWAPLIKLFKSRSLTVIILIVVLKITIMVLMFLFFKNTVLYQVLSYLKFESMAIGALGAYIVFNSKKEIKQIFSEYFSNVEIGLVKEVYPKKIVNFYTIKALI